MKRTLRFLPGRCSPGRLHACVVGAALAASIVVPARAQPESAPDLARARELFAQGTDQRDAGDARGALEKLKAAHELAPNPVTAVELGRTYAMLGLLLEAREAFPSVAGLPAQPDASARSTQARQDAARLADDAKDEIRAHRRVRSGQGSRPLPCPIGFPCRNRGRAFDRRGRRPRAGRVHRVWGWRRRLHRRRHFPPCSPFRRLPMRKTPAAGAPVPPRRPTT